MSTEPNIRHQYSVLTQNLGGSRCGGFTITKLNCLVFFAKIGAIYSTKPYSASAKAKTNKTARLILREKGFRDTNMTRTDIAGSQQWTAKVKLIFLQSSVHHDRCDHETLNKNI